MRASKGSNLTLNTETRRHPSKTLQLHASCTRPTSQQDPGKTEDNSSDLNVDPNLSHLVSVDHQDGGGEGILAGDEPVLVEAVQLLDVLQRDHVLLRLHPHVNPLQRLLGRGAEVYDHVHNERPSQELEPLVENLVLAADDIAGPEHVHHEAVADTEDVPLHQLDWLVTLVLSSHV